MDEGATECLVFASPGNATAQMLRSALAEWDICVTRSMDTQACLDLLGARRWNCLVVDASGQSSVALDLLSQCRRVYPDVRVLVLVRHGDTETAVRAMKAGAADCVETLMETGRVASAVRAVCCRADHESLEGWARLTRMERTVLGHLLEGHTNQQIAEALCRSHRTIEVHRRHIMSKLDAANVVDLVKRSMQIDEASR
jgi:DNA-binding NarL/FixJ family response regulator